MYFYHKFVKKNAWPYSLLCCSRISFTARSYCIEQQAIIEWQLAFGRLHAAHCSCVLPVAMRMLCVSVFESLLLSSMYNCLPQAQKYSLYMKSRVVSGHLYSDMRGKLINTRVAATPSLSTYSYPLDFPTANYVQCQA